MVNNTPIALPKGPGRRSWRPEPAQPTPPAPTGKAQPSRIASPRILFVNQYYWPDHASTAQHLTDLAESLAAQGVECHVVCSQGAYKPGSPPLPRRETHNGVIIHRIPATSLGRRSTLRRMVDYLSFYAGAALRCLSMPRFDAVVTLTTPPIIGLVGTLLRALKGSQHVYWSMDLHPDASIALGRMKRSNPIVRLLATLSDFVYRRADRVVALGPYMADRLRAKGVRDARLVEIPVWSRADEIDPLPLQNHPLREQLGLSNQFVVMYSGNLGLAHSADEFLQAARALQHREEIVFLFVGGGPRSGQVRAAVQQDKLSNVRMLDYFPREQLHASLSMANVHLVSMRSEMTGIVVPGKLYGAMASSRPVVFVGPDHCETSDTIRAAQCGRTVRLGDVDGLVSVLNELADDPKLASRLGENGRNAFMEAFERAHCCAQWSALVADLNAIPGRVETGVRRRPLTVRMEP